MKADKHSSLGTQTLLLLLVILIVAACVYFLFSTLTRHGGVGTTVNKAPPLTVEEKAAVLHALSQSSAGNAGATPAATPSPSEAAERLRTLESVAQSSSDSPAGQQSAAEKAKILESLQSQ